MKLTIFLDKGDGKGRTQFKADMKDERRASVATCDLLFADMATSDLARGLELKKWKIKRGREKWNGLGHERSPEIRDGDVVMLYAARKAEA